MSYPKIMVVRQTMKKVEITKFSFAEVDAPKEMFGFLKIPSGHTLLRAEGDDLEVSDGYHTFDELYDHRITLYITLCHMLKAGEFDGKADVWRSKRHSDGELCFGTGSQFVMGIGREKGEQVTYHIPIERWNETAYAETLDKSPEWDGHSSADVLERLRRMN